MGRLGDQENALCFTRDSQDFKMVQLFTQGWPPFIKTSEQLLRASKWRPL